jgi:hypothetical protein
MKYVRYLALAIFTFVIGVAISPIRFYPEWIGCGPRGSSTSYRSSYFMQTVDSYVSYDCEEHASDAFNERLRDAISVYDRSPKVNKQGVLIEQRAVALFYHEGNNEYYVKAFWTEGKTLRVISSRSIVHVMDFEKQNF